MAIASKPWKQKRVERAGTKREVTAAISRRDRILSNWNSVIIERKIRRINRNAVTRGSTCAENFSVRGKRAQQPIESEFLEIILVNLDKLRFDRYLFGRGRIGLINQGIHHIQIVLGVANDESPAVRPECCACPSLKRDTHTLQHCLGIRSADKLAIVQQGLASSGSTLHYV